MSRRRRRDPDPQPRSQDPALRAGAVPVAAPTARPPAPPPQPHPAAGAEREAAPERPAARGLELRQAPRDAPDSGASGSGHRCVTRSPRGARGVRFSKSVISSSLALMSRTPRAARATPAARENSVSSRCPRSSPLRLRRLRDVQALEIAQQKRLPLPVRQLLQCLLQRGHRLIELQAARRA